MKDSGLVRGACALACLAAPLWFAAPASADPPWREGWHRGPPHRWGPPPPRYHRGYPPPRRYYHPPRHYGPPVYYVPPPVYLPPPAYPPPGFSFGFTVPLR